MSMLAQASTRTFSRRLLVVFAVGLLGLILWASPAAAHVDFLGSSPANVSAVPGPVSEIVLEFSGAAEPIESDFRIENSSGESLPIDSVANDGEAKVVVTSAAPLPTGRTKVLWALRGADGHKMSGSVSFTVTAEASAAPPTTIAANQSTTTAVPSAETRNEAGSFESAIAAISTTTNDDSGVAETIGVVARWIVYASILLTVGALAYLLWVHRGTRAEGRRIVFFIRRAAVLVILASVVEWFAQLALWGTGSVSELVSPSAWGDLLTTGFAFGTLLRLVGAALVLKFVAMDVVPDQPSERAATADLDWIAAPEENSLMLVDERAPSITLTRVRVESGPLAILGALLLVVSESFIGHTASVEPRALMALSDAVHLTAAGIWAAGAWLLAATLWRRHRRGEPVDAALLATRFSLLATVSLIAVAVSGVVLAWAILEQLSALWSSEFGRLLLAKTFVVFVIGCFGLHNRRVVLPALVSGDERFEDSFRKTIAIEAGLFVVVLLITSLLVIANPLS